MCAGVAARGEADRAVVEAAQQGALWAQDELVGAYLPLVYNIVGRALNGHADVDDVVQESMLRALRGLGALHDPAGFRSWLVAITMNQVRTYWSRQQAAFPGSDLQDAYEVADPGADFVDLTIVRLGLEGQRREVAQATRWLDTDDRALLALWWLEAAGELSRAEVAAALGLSPQHTGVRVQRMKAQLETARLVVRALAATPPCPGLARLTGDWDHRPSALWRKRIARHARECTVCSGHQAGLVPAEGLLVGLALVPVVGAAVGLPGLAPFHGAEAGHASTEATEAMGEGLGTSYQDVSPYADMAPTQPSSGNDTTVLHAADPAGPSHGGRQQLRAQERIRRRRRTTGMAAAIAVLIAGGTLATLEAMPSDGDRQDDTVRSAADSTSATPTKDVTPSSPTATPSPSHHKSRSPKPRKTHAKPKPKPKPSKTKTPPPKPRPTPKPTAAPARTPAEKVLALVNSERSKAGCRPVKLDSRLSRAAQLHSEDMSTNHYFDHTSQDGRTFSDRATAQGYRTPGAENIARGQSSPESVMQSWMNSPGHRANILNCDLTTMGLGLVDDDWTWTQMFGF
ncbi:sigma-70 family RNA polymerase sigma factor [Streptomyces sp. NPDC059009]|uniref:sigma-70 family RNA polymerase sigma factor n=1 Tax=Streptomyces sp. NPDC059009 TaxID=3346694 RepID=UPI00369845DC